MTRPTRLLFVSSTFPYGKRDTFLGPELRELVHQGVDVRVVPMRPLGDLSTAEAGPYAVHHPLLDVEILSGAIREVVRSPLAVLAALRVVLRQPNPRILLRNLAAVPKALWLARLARSWRADHIHVHWAGPPATAALVAARLSGVPWSLTAHRADITENNLLREKCGAAAFVRFISRDGMRLARDAAPGIDESNWTVLHLGVDLPETWTTADTLNDPAVVLLPAHFVPEKRHATLVEAARRLIEEGRSVEIWLAGRGPLQEEVRRQADELGLAHVVRFLDYVPNEQVLGWLAAHRVDAVVLPSAIEGISVAAIEALAFGVPVVAASVGGMPELLGDGCGELVDTGDPAGFAAAIGRLFDSAERRIATGRAGRSRVETEFAAALTVRRLRELLGFERAND